jgi:(p)ppGpp synthase/HD superfamily hydrolase
MRTPATVGAMSGLVERARAMAVEVHRNALRKGTDVPYFEGHLEPVASYVRSAGGSDVQIAAAYLHDAVEDGGGTAMLSRIRSELGEDVARIVEHLSDSVVDTTAGDAKAPWAERKVAYLSSLPGKPKESLEVSAADKLHNAESILADFRIQGDALWQRFSMKEPKFHLWYYGALAHILSDALGDHPLAVRLADTVRALADEVRAVHPDLDAEVAALGEQLGLWVELRGRIRRKSTS